MKKYLVFMCFVCLELNTELLTSSHMVDWLFWKRMFCLAEYPCASMYFLVWRIEGRTWSSPTSSDSVDILVFILCLCEKLMPAPLPSYIISPVLPLQS